MDSHGVNVGFGITSGGIKILIFSFMCCNVIHSVNALAALYAFQSRRGFYSQLDENNAGEVLLTVTSGGLKTPSISFIGRLARQCVTCLKIPS